MPHALCTLLLVAEVARAREATPALAHGSGDETLLLQVALHQHSHDPLDAGVISDLKRLLLEEQGKPQKLVSLSVPWLFSLRWQERPSDRLALLQPGTQDHAVLSAARSSAASGEQETANDGPILATARNPGDLGRLFIMEPLPVTPNWFYLKTWFGGYVSLSDWISMNFSVNIQSTNASAAAPLTLERHPFVPRMFCLKFLSGHCVGTAGLERRGGWRSQPVVPRMPSAKHPWATAVSFTSWMDVKEEVPLCRFSFANGQVLSAMPSLQARASHKTSFGRAGLASCTLVGGCLTFLLIYNISAAWIGKSKPRERRLPHFDVTRFLLETLVVHSHLHFCLGLDAGVPGLPWLVLLTNSFRMPAFMIIAGIFGGNTSYESWSKSLCCTLGTYCLMAALSMVQFTPEHFQIGVAILWFLLALAANRSFISPLFSRAREISEARKSCLPVFGAFASVKVASYLLMHGAKSWGWDNDPGYVGYLVLQFLAFAPFFAFGLLLTPTEWDALLRRRWMQAASIMYFAAWYLLMLSPSFLQWNASYCLPGLQQRGCTDHYDPEQVSGPHNILSLLFDLLMFGFRIGISVSFMSGVALVCDLVASVLPTLVELLAGWGSRTLYTYVLHGYCFVLLNQHGLLLLNDIFSAPVIKWVPDVMGPLFLNAVLSSQGSEHWLKWLVMPFWIKDLCQGHLRKSND